MIYSEAMKSVTGISDDDAKEIGSMPGMIANAKREGLQLLQVQFKVFNKYIERRLEEYIRTDRPFISGIDAMIVRLKENGYSDDSVMKMSLKELISQNERLLKAKNTS